VSANADLSNVRRANRALEALWRSGLAPRPRLEAEALEKAALRGAPAHAFGTDDRWREPFHQLLKSLREDAQLNALGLTMAHGQIVMMLRARLRAVALWRAHPEILERPIAAPILILGQMRSGTTRLHRLLACDDRFAHSRAHESLIPVPFGDRPRRADARMRRAWAALTMLRWLNPELGRIHPTWPAAAEEEFGLFSFSFGSPQHEAQWRVPGFSRWWEAADAGPLYGEFRALLQTNGWYRGEDSGKPWILKAPRFLEDLPVLLRIFPDARLVCLDRPLNAVVASAASLAWQQMRLQSDAADKSWIGPETLRRTLRRRDRMQEALAARPDVPRIDLGFEAMNRDWEAEIVRLYAFLDLDLPAVTLARMRTYLAGQNAHLGHLYSLDEFGLEAAALT
jgi:hypothetical protein